MTTDDQNDGAANAAAEEILRIIYGDDLRGCAISVDRLTAVIQTALAEKVRGFRDVAELHLKGFEAVQLLSTPPPDGQALSEEDLRALLGDRLDKIRTLATKILDTTGHGRVALAGGNGIEKTGSRGSS